MQNFKLLILATILCTGCGNKNREYHAGPRGGCYYITDSGEKEYVDREKCHQGNVGDSQMSDSQREELNIFRQLFVKEFEKLSSCKLLTLDGSFRAANYQFQATSICADKQKYVSAQVYNATLPSGKPIKVMEFHEPKAKIFIDSENYMILERILDN